MASSLGPALLLSIALLHAAGGDARADGDAAMVTQYRVAPGRTDDFVDGYARHIQWHLQARDPWAWYVWQVRTGPQRGHFVGGTFDHAWSEHERRPRPDEDAADHRRQIDRHLASSLPRHLVRRRDLGGALPLLETAPELVMIEIRPAPGKRSALEAAARDLAALAGPDARFGWYEVVVGGAPAFLLMIPLARTSDLPTAHHARVWRAPASRAAQVRTAVDRLEAATASIDSTLLALRPDLSSCVRADTRCVGVVP